MDLVLSQCRLVEIQHVQFYLMIHCGVGGRMDPDNWVEELRQQPKQLLLRCRQPRQLSYRSNWKWVRYIRVRSAMWALRGAGVRIYTDDWEPAQRLMRSYLLPPHHSVQRQHRCLQDLITHV